MRERGVAGVVLAGGLAKRMGGVPKGMLRLNGHLSLIERIVIQMLGSGIKEIVIAANETSSYAHIGCPIVADSRQNAGPLAGIEAALAYFAGRYDAILCSPCDLPGLSSEEMQVLVRAFSTSRRPIVLAETNGGMKHPLCAVIRADLRDRISAALDQGMGAVDALWRKIGCDSVHFNDPQAFVNLNWPQDVDVWLAEQGSLPQRG